MTMLSGKKKIAIVGLVAAAALAVAPRAAAAHASTSAMARTNAAAAGGTDNSPTTHYLSPGDSLAAGTNAAGAGVASTDMGALCCGSAAAAHVLKPSTSTRTTPLLQRLVKGLVREGAPGALAEVRTQTRIRRAAAGVSQRQPRLALRATDRWRVASITKSFVATVVLELVAEGKLSLDDTVEHWLPGLVPNGAAITLRELLNHTSGLFNYNDDPIWVPSLLADPRRIWLPTELVALADSQTPYFSPGTGWHYANTNYVLLGRVIEAATGRSLGDELRDRIFQPLGLGATSFPMGPDASGLAHAYVGEATLMIPSGLQDITTLLNPSWLWAAGALVSDADDVTTFYARLLSGRILRPDLLTAMRTVTPPARDYGLGLMRFDTYCGRLFGHEGDFNGYRSVAVSRPNGSRVAVVMVNVDTTYVSWGELDADAELAACSG
jgi:D-alanyl-D-alanine carboxypeptidase